MNDAFNYIAVLMSIIIGLAATRLLSAMSEMLQVANRPRIYWVHTMWVLTLFVQVLLSWWVLYRWHYVTNWTFFLFVWVTIPAILMYLASAVLSPGELETSGSPDWRDYYYKNRRSFFLIFGAIAPLDIGTPYSKANNTSLIRASFTCLSSRYGDLAASQPPSLQTRVITPSGPSPSLP